MFKHVRKRHYFSFKKRSLTRANNQFLNKKIHSILLIKEYCHVFSMDFKSLSPESSKCSRNSFSGAPRLDDFIYKSALCCHKWVCETFFVVCSMLNNLFSFPRSFLCIISVAPFAPITAISAVGHA